MFTKVLYYRSPRGDRPIKKFLSSLTKTQQSKIIRVFEYIETYGISAPIPHVKKMSGLPFWEIRIIGKDNIRVIYATVYKDSILILHGFIKKKQRTPQKDLKIALERYKEAIDR